VIIGGAAVAAGVVSFGGVTTAVAASAAVGSEVGQIAAAILVGFIGGL